MKSVFYDGLYRISVANGLVKMSFVNIEEKDGKSEIANKDDILVTMKAFLQLRASVEDIFNKLVQSKESNPVKLQSKEAE